MIGQFSATWGNDARTALQSFVDDSFYKTDFDKQVQVRINKEIGPENIPFLALIEQSQPESGRYGGMSPVIFPNDSGKPLLALGIGTNGLNPDEQILGRPGHARKSRALAKYLRKKYPKVVAWAKVDPTRTDADIPTSILELLPNHDRALDRYGKYLYVVVGVDELSESEIREVAHSLFYFSMSERGVKLKKAAEEIWNKIKAEISNELFEIHSPMSVLEQLVKRRFVVLQGPPGVGKTRMANEVAKSEFFTDRMIVQFHPGTSYESFIGGLSPNLTTENTLNFVAKRGHLLEAIALAHSTEGNVLLYIDEFNRADISKVLGEAVGVFEPGDLNRTILLERDYGEGIGRQLSIPPNLYVLASMNTADRSIAHLDIAIRRRFAFLTMMPHTKALIDSGSCDQAKVLFNRLADVFVDYSYADSFSLMPGHSYFLAKTLDDLRSKYEYELAPLLREYIAQGYVTSFSEHVEAFMTSAELLLSK